MRRLAIIILLAIPLLPSFDADAPRLVKTATAADDASAKAAFDTAREMGTVEAWNAFLESYPEGFHANLARSYLKRLGGGESKPASNAKEKPSAGGGRSVPTPASTGSACSPTTALGIRTFHRHPSIQTPRRSLPGSA